MNNIIIRRATKPNDLEQIKHLFKVVFSDEGVDTLAEIFHNYLPEWKADNWFLAEDTHTQQIVSGFCLIPWRWAFNNVQLKAAEMGLVATLPKYRGKGLMKRLNAEFNAELDKQNYHLAVIQGIPGFYHKFGYYYAVPMEKHITLALNNNFIINNNFKIYEATENDIEFLMSQDEVFSSTYNLSVMRSFEQWTYLLSYSKETEYGSEFWIVEDSAGKEKFYFRVNNQGFGSGLVISEISEEISNEAFSSAISFLNTLAKQRNKPFLRFNISADAAPSKQLINWGATQGKSYRWQIKITSIEKFLHSIKVVLEQRIKNSTLNGFTGKYHINFYSHAIDLIWKNGNLTNINAVKPNDESNVLNVATDMFVPLVLGCNSWEELQAVRPDIFPGDLYFDPTVSCVKNKSVELTEVLFPKAKAWINCQY